MADESSQSIVVAAKPEAVLAVIADFPAYPDWADYVRTCEVLETGPDGRPLRVRFVLDASAVKDDYVLEYRWSPHGTRVDWHLVSGQMQKAQDGSYALRVVPEGTEVTYTLSVTLSVPMIGLFKRKAEKVIMDTALRELKKRVEMPAGG